MENNEKNENNVSVYKEKKSSNVAKIIAVVVGALLISVLSSLVTYFLVTRGGYAITSNNTTYNVENVENPVVAVSKIAGPSAVGIKINYYAQSFFGIQEATAEGSGIIYSEDGYIITNNHVIEEAASTSNATVTVILPDGTECEAKIIGRDSVTDLALLKIETDKELVAATFGKSSELEVGQMAVAIGNPLGLEFSGSVTVGYISALNRSMTIDGRTFKLIQTDAAINPGNSGGALVNAKGEVIGINTAKIADSEVEGLGFAIPIDDALVIIEELKSNGKIVRPYIGISGIDVDEETARRNNLVEGVYVYQVYTNSPAAKIGVLKGDIIVEFDNQKVSSIQEINDIKNQKKIGDKVKIKVYRNGEYLEDMLTLSGDDETYSDDVTN